MLLITETLESIFKRISENQKIMTLMGLPTVKYDDTEDIKKAKINKLIKKYVTKTAQNPTYLGEKVIPITIDKITYKDYGNIRVTISIIQGSSLSSDIFGNPKIEINVYYDNSNPDKALKILDTLSNEFSGKDLDVYWEDEDNKTYLTKRELKCDALNTQSQNINNYEVVGIRFSFYASHYVPYC